VPTYGRCTRELTADAASEEVDREVTDHLKALGYID